METKLIYSNGVYLLARNNNQLICPFIGRVVIPQKKLMETEFIPAAHPCSSLCPHFTHKPGQGGEAGEVYLSCSGTQAVIKLTSNEGL